MAECHDRHSVFLKDLGNSLTVMSSFVKNSFVADNILVLQ